MSSEQEAAPPLHRRYSHRKAIASVRERYRGLQDRIPEQVAILQADTEFRAKCQEYYGRGLKDWVIISAIYNCMCTWFLNKSDVVRRNRFGPDEMKGVCEKVDHNTFPAWRFVEEDFDIHVSMHNFACLQSYGFEQRRPDLRGEVVERFLRERMRHFEPDIAHAAMFGEPPGDWPKT